MRKQTFPGRAERSDNREIVMAFSEALRKEAIKQANTVIFQIKQSIEVSKHDVYGH